MLHMLLIIPGERFSSLIVLNLELLMGWTAWVCIPYILIVSLSLNDSQNAYDMMPETFLFSLFPHNILTDSQLAFYMIWCIYRLPLQLMNVYDWRKVHTRWFNFNFTSILPTSSSSLFVQSLTSMLIASIDCGVCQLQMNKLCFHLFVNTFYYMRSQILWTDRSQIFCMWLVSFYTIISTCS